MSFWHDLKHTHTRTRTRTQYCCLILSYLCREVVSDGLAALMEMCHQKGSKESVSGLVDSTGRNGVLDESLPVAMDETLPLSLDEDLGGKGCYCYWDMIVNQSVCN